MSDDLDIRYGGAIAVDTEDLRDVGRRLGVLVTRLHDAEDAVARAYGALAEARGFAGEVPLVQLRASGDRIGSLGQETRDASSGTFVMADAYEVVELRAQAEALGVSDAAAASAVQARLDRLLASDDRLGAMADQLVAAWEERRFEGLDRQFSLGALSDLFLVGAASAVVSGFGTLPPGMVLRGRADAVTVTPVRTSKPGGPPTSLSAALSRFPKTPEAQVRVEQYTMADGTRRFVAYVKGTRSVAFGGAEPWDMRSNQQLYAGEKSASYQATADAIAAAGAEPGDRVDLVAYSQGGMIASHVAMESEFDVGVLITAGSPTEPSLDDDQLLIQLRHTDDVVSSMAAGGSPGGTGSPDSFTAERVGDPERRIQDLVLAPHMLDEYIETAEMVEASGDERVAALDELWSELDQAVEIESTDYLAERPG